MAEDTLSSTHPQLPPTTEDNRHSWLRLLRSRRVGPTTFHKLIAKYGTASAALEALPGIARAAGHKTYEICPEAVIAAELDAARLTGAAMLCLGDSDYPPLLAELPDAPPILWTLGDRALLKRPALALVGARNASSLGTRMARTLAKDLGSHGMAIVSGLARGVDAAAHDAALETGTIAVFAGGVDVIYPTENAELAEHIRNQGLILSEAPMGRAPLARHFPARNRIVAGLCQATVVVEAAARSGSLHTARTALDQGREVLAVPGHPFDARAAGCNMLIRDGATLVRGSKDVREAIATPAAPPLQASLDLPPASPKPPRDPKQALRDTARLHERILKCLGQAPVAEDQLIRDLKAPAQSVTPVLLELEMSGRVSRSAGGLLRRS